MRMRSTSILKPKLAELHFGGKANNLLLLEEMELNVPQWVVIPSQVMTQQLQCSDSNLPLKNALEELLVPKEIFDQFNLYFGADYRQLKYAVRSSAMAEDGINHSYAGQFVTKLNVAYADLEDAIKAVWKSVDSPHLKSYRTEQELDIEFGIAVIIQVMVPSEISGVAFGMDPVSGDTSKKIVSAVPGLGEGLVSGQMNGDNFTISSDGTIVQSAYTEGTLDNFQLLEISELLDALNTKTGRAQDVEFAYSDNQLYVLQTRPVTTKPRGKDEYLVWDNSNIIESYPGVTTPMTFSFITKMYAAVYIQLCQLLGVSTKTINDNKEVFENTLGLVRGRVYYNLLSWYKMLAMVPGYSLNAGFMETMMGVKEKFELGDSFRMSKTKASFRIILMIVKMLWLNLTLSNERIKFKKFVDRKLQEYGAYDYSKLPIVETLIHYKNYEQTLLEEWKVPLVNDFFSMIWFGLLKNHTSKLTPSEANIHNDLLCGSQDIISVEPIHRTLALTKSIRENETWNALFLDHTKEFIWTALSSQPYASLKVEIDQYLEDFGERCMGELKLETTSYSQDPTLFIKILKGYVANGVGANAIALKLDSQLRKVAENKLNTALKGKPFRRFWFQVILKQARSMVSNRENLRYERTRAFGVVRKMINGIGARLVDKKILTSIKDIFYLELDDMLQLVSSDYTQLVNQIRTTKARFEAYELQPDPQERFSTHGYFFDDSDIYSEDKIEAIQGDLQGIGCCPGQVKAKVQVVVNPNEIDSLNGDILVTRSTDPGWVTLFPSAAAIIVERGSLLSHSAIVAREMGIPCIVSVDGLLRTLKSGDEILMDGSTGTIKVLSGQRIKS